MPKTLAATAPVNETATYLQPILVDLISLSLMAKQVHWNVTGPFFGPLHEMFDRFHQSYGGWSDSVAERIRALGAPADGRLSTVASGAGIEELPSGLIADRDAIRLFLTRVEALAGRLREKLDLLGNQDLVTQDMVIGIVEGLEKQTWMLRAQKA